MELQKDPLQTGISNIIDDITTNFLRAKYYIELLELIRKLSKPVVCAVNGPVLGGGLGLFFVSINSRLK